MKKLVSVIVPLLNENSLKIIFDELIRIKNELISKFDFEFTFIDDGSDDDTFNQLNLISKENDFVKVISFTRVLGINLQYLPDMNLQKEN